MHNLEPAIKLQIRSARDILLARQQAREMAASLGFHGGDVTSIVAAISEVARNIVDFAGQGEVEFECLQQGRRRGLLITARDEGPGISDIPQAMQYGYSSGNGLGLGLPGAKWLLDEFDISSSPGKGTTVTMKKWLG